MVSSKPTEPNIRFASYIRNAMSRAGDSAGGLTQDELAAAIGVSRSYIARMCAGTAGIIYPNVFNRLRESLGLVGWEALQLMGYQTDASNNAQVLPALQLALADTSPDEQRDILRIIRHRNHAGQEHTG